MNVSIFKSLWCGMFEGSKSAKSICLLRNCAISAGEGASTNWRSTKGKRCSTGQRVKEKLSLISAELCSVSH